MERRAEWLGRNRKGVYCPELDRPVLGKDCYLPAVIAIGASVAGPALAGSAVFAGLGLGVVGTSILGSAISFGISHFAGELLGVNDTGLEQESASGVAQSEARGIQVNTASPTEAIPVVYGARLVGGNRIFGPELSGAHSEFLHEVITWSEGEIEEVSLIRLDDRLSTIGRFDGAVELTHKLGTAGQTAITTLVARTAKWTDDHRFDGVAGTYVRLLADQDVWVSGMPVVTAKLKGVKCLDLRTSTTIYTQNFAWVIRDVLVNTIYGLGVPAADIDSTSFIAAANYYEESVTVPGGTQQRFKCNGRMDTANEPPQNLRLLLSCCRSALFWSAGVWKLVPDKAGSSVMTLDRDNIIGGWSISLPSKTQRRNRVIAEFFDEDNLHRPNFATSDSETLRDDEDAGEVLSKTIALPFITNQYTAEQICNIELKTSRTGIGVQVTCTIAALKLEIFDVVTIDHAHPGWTGASTKDFRVKAIEQPQDGEVVLTLAEYSAAALTPATPGAKFGTASDTGLPDPFDAPAPTGLVLASGTDHLIIGGDGTIFSRVFVEWDEPGSIFTESTEVQARKTAATAWTPITLNADPDCRCAYVSNVEDGVSYDVRARHRMVTGVRSSWQRVNGHVVVGKTAPPSDVPWVEMDGTRTVRFGSVSDKDLAGYRIRTNAGVNDDWANGTPVYDGIIQHSPYEFVVAPFGVTTIMVKAEDTSGNLSTTPTTAVVNLGDQLVANVVQTQDEHAAGFTGTKTNATVNGGTGDLEADVEATPLMWGPDDQVLAWANDNALMWGTVTYKPMVYEFTVSPTAGQAGSLLTLDATYLGASVVIEYRHVGGVLMWDSDDSVPMWSSEDSTLMWDVPAFTAWPGSVTVLNERYEFRISISGGVTRGAISELKAQVDVLDRLETFDDVAIVAAGTRLSLAGAAWNVINNVQLTTQDDGGGGLIAVAFDKNATTGPLIKIFNASGVAVDGSVDATLQGY